MELYNLLEMRYQIVAVILFCIGFATLFLHPNLIKKIIGLNLMDAAVFLMLAAVGCVDGGKAPIIVNGITDASYYINPVPGGLVLTGIVVAVSTTAFFLALTQRLYHMYHTLDLDEILMLAKEATETDANH